jgi:pimeloyl-[acyl-carrier protein] methyl ester esterase
MPETALILLPGLDGSGVMLRPLLQHLPREIRAIPVSYPKDKMLGYADLLPLVLAAIPADLPFVLLGESFGGPLALMVAAKHPPGLVGVILCATFVRNPLWFRPRWLRHFFRPLPFRMYPMAARLKAKIGGYATKELTALKAEALAGVRPEVIAHRVRSTLTVNVTPELCACNVPMLYLRGDRDFLVPRQNLKEITTLCPTVKVAHFPSPHMILQTQPALAAEAIASFIASLGNQKAGAISDSHPALQASPAPGSPPQR